MVIRRSRTPKPFESIVWLLFYGSLALAFTGLLLIFGTGTLAGEFLAGWLTEYSLSVDNLFVFVLIFARFRVPKMIQQHLLMIGIILALVFRGVFIALGAVLIANLSWMFYLFGIFLLQTAYKQSFARSKPEKEKDSAIVLWLRRKLSVSDEFDGRKMRTELNGKRMYTPMILVISTLALTDLLFALDSIPAIFGITQNAFIVFSANVFALMGLRQLYFLLGHLVEKLEYLVYGIAVILGFIGIKLILHALHHNEVFFIYGGQNISWAPEIGVVPSLMVIVGAMTVSVCASVWKMRRN